MWKLHLLVETNEGSKAPFSLSSSQPKKEMTLAGGWGAPCRVGGLCDIAARI